MCFPAFQTFDQFLNTGRSVLVTLVTPSSHKMSWHNTSCSFATNYILLNVKWSNICFNWILLECGSTGHKYSTYNSGSTFDILNRKITAAYRGITLRLYWQFENALLLHICFWKNSHLNKKLIQMRSVSISKSWESIYSHMCWRTICYDFDAHVHEQKTWIFTHWHCIRGFTKQCVFSGTDHSDRVKCHLYSPNVSLFFLKTLSYKQNQNGTAFPGNKCLFCKVS